MMKKENKLEEEKALQAKAETATPSNEQFKKAIAKSKIDELKVKVIYELDELTSLAKENQLVDEFATFILRYKNNIEPENRYQANSVLERLFDLLH